MGMTFCGTATPTILAILIFTLHIYRTKSFQTPTKSIAPTAHTKQQQYRIRLQMSHKDDDDSTITKNRFQSRSIVLTGASSGLGRSMALQLSKLDVATLILSGRNVDALNDVADQCRSLSAAARTKVHVIPCDLSDLDAVQKLGEESLGILNSDGVVDVFIHCGGLSSRSRFLETSLEVDEMLMKVNFLSGAALAKKFVPGMIKKGNGGMILFISSVQGLFGIPNRTSYAASKFAVQGYCEALRAELANDGITVHVASPGYIKTNLSKSAMKGDGTKYGKMDDTTASGAEPDDVAVSILESVANGENDFVVAAGLSAKAAIWLRLLAPSFLQKMLVQRYEKSLVGGDKK